MKTFFIDTNILIDYLSDRKPFSITAAKLFSHFINKKVKLIVSAISFNNIYYILRQNLPHQNVLQLLENLLEMVEVEPLTKRIIENSIKINFKDFEDAIQYNSALNYKKVDAIITRNTKDFKNSALPVLLPEEALKIIENEN
jgi:predicted nucleic acid-binding protein